MIVIIGICILELFVIFWGLNNKGVEYIIIDDSYSHAISPFELDDGDKRIITMNQFRHIAKHMGFDIVQDVDDLYRIRISPQNSLMNSTPDLEPLKRSDSNLIIESDLYGYWISATQDRALGFQFQPTDEFGPYTIVKVDGLLADGSTSEVKIGFYQVVDSQTLILQFRQELDFDDEDSVRAINEVEEWSVSKVGEFFVLKNGEQQLNISKFQQQEPIVEGSNLE